MLWLFLVDLGIADRILLLLRAAIHKSGPRLYLLVWRFPVFDHYTNYVITSGDTGLISCGNLSTTYVVVRTTNDVKLKPYDK